MATRFIARAITSIVLEFRKTYQLNATGKVAHTLGRSHAVQSYGDISSPYTSIEMHSHVLFTDAVNPSVALTSVKSTCDLTIKSRGVISYGKSKGSRYFYLLRFFHDVPLKCINVDMD
jgi:hypothetical protein